MKRFLVAALVFTLGCWGCAGTTEPPRPPSLLRVVPEVLQTMHEIQSEFEVETARCLTGFVKDRVIYVQGMESTGGIMEQTSNMVAFRACTGNNVVGWYHNHPPDRPVTYCRITSQGDIETLAYGRNFWVAVITCDGETVVYRFKLDNFDNISRN